MGLRDLRINRLYAARNLAHKYTATGAAEAMGVSVPTYRKWEEHPELLTRQQADRLADYFGCSTEAIFYLPKKDK